MTDELQQAYEEYIKFLGDQISSNAGFMYAHNIQCSKEDYEKWVELREKIQKLKYKNAP